MSKALELRHERAALVAQMKQYLDSSPASRNRWAELDRHQESLRVQIENLERQDEIGRLENELFSVDRRGAQLPSFGGPQSEMRDTGVIASPEYRDAFRKYLRKGTPIEASLGPMEQRTYSGLSDAADGVLVPAGFMRELEIKLLAYGQMRQACRVIATATGNPLPWPTMDDTTNEGTWLSEAAPVNQTNPTYANVQLGANMLSSDQVLISVQLLQDSAFNMEAELAQAFGTRLGRGCNKAYTVGDGSVIPITGLVTALVAAGGRSIAAVGANSNSGNSGDTDINSIGSDDLDNLIAGVDVAYRSDKSCAFMAHQNTFDTLRKVKDKYGRPIWQTSLAAGVPDSLCGFKYFFNNAMDQIGANKKTVLFGAFSKYVIRDVLGMTVVRYNELYMPNHQIGFEAFMRSDGKLLQPAAFVYLLTGAS